MTSTSNRLARLREAQGLTRQELAGLTPSKHQTRSIVDTRTIHRWERGETPIPQRYWQPLADLFGVSIAHLLGLDDDDTGGSDAA